MRVAVIGAGVSGLLSTRYLIEEGIEPVVFERTGSHGGVWEFDERQLDGGGLGYRSLRANTTKEITAFSDAPFPADLPDFPHRSAMLEYLHAYADAHHLRHRIRFHTAVTHVGPLPDRQWCVEARYQGKQEREIFDAVTVCSGVHARPLTPSYRGLEGYSGRTLHAAGYTGPEGFEGQDVLVVGAGNSAGDIAVEVSRIARSVTLSMRTGAWFIPHALRRRALDQRLTRFGRLLPQTVKARIFCRLLTEEYRRLGVDARIASLDGQTPAFDIERSRLTVNSEILPLIAAGQVVLRPDIARIDGEHVLFLDGSSSRPDTIIFATGYAPEFPFLDPSIQPFAAGMLSLYRRVFFPDAPGLAFIGMVKASGSVWPVMELQARWMARVFAGRAQLPSSAQMHEEIDARLRRALERRLPLLKIDLLAYLDELAEQIGARPNLLRHPDLLVPLLLGPPVAAQYRLDGPDRWPGAKAAIKGAMVRK